MDIQTFSALSDPTRFHIVEMLAENGSLPVSEIKNEFEISAPAVSQHLKVLKEASLVNVEINAQQRIYSLNPDGISSINGWVDKLMKLWNDRFDALDKLLMEEMKKGGK